MSNEYDAIYAAVRSRIGSFDASGLCEAIAREFDVSYQKTIIMEKAIETLGNIESAMVQVATEAQRPSIQFRPELSMDKERERFGFPTVWVASYGSLNATGSTPAEAMAAFDKAWVEKE